MSGQYIRMVVGSPASGKSSFVKNWVEKGYVLINRDTHKGASTLADLIPFYEKAIQNKSDIILDNTFPTIASRKPFVDLAAKYNVPIFCKVMDTSTEDCQINALMRMHERYGKVFLDLESLKEVKGDPNMFPSAALFKYRKEFEMPTENEGFKLVDKISFVRQPWPKDFLNKAVIFDYDDTLRTSTGDKPYPVKLSDIKLLPGRKEMLKKYQDLGYILLGVSNQSGIAKGDLTKEMAIQCFEETNKQLGFKIDYNFCSHRIPPMTCYCRKPQSGLGLHFILKYKLNPKECIMVGDMTSDKTFAKRIGFQYQDQSEFFK